MMRMPSDHCLFTHLERFKFDRSKHNGRKFLVREQKRSRFLVTEEVALCSLLTSTVQNRGDIIDFGKATTDVRIVLIQLQSFNPAFSIGPPSPAR